MRSKNKRKPHFLLLRPLPPIFSIIDLIFSFSSNLWGPVFHFDRFERSGWNSATRNARTPAVKLWAYLSKIPTKKKIPLKASGHPTQLASWCAVKSYVSLLLNGKLIAGDNIMRQSIYNTVSPSLTRPEREKTFSAHPAEPPRIRGAHRDLGMRAILLASPCPTCVTGSEEWLLLFGGGGRVGAYRWSALLWCAACLLTSKRQSSRTAPYGPKRVIASYTQRKWEEKASAHTHSTHTLLHRFSL